MSFESPLSTLFDTKGVELNVSASQQIESNVTGVNAQPGILMAGSGSDGKVRFFQASDDGKLFITGSVTSEGANNDQGNHGTPDQSWYMVITDGTSSTALGSAESTPLFISGTVATEGPDGTAADPIHVTGALTVEVDTVDQGNHGTADQSWYTVITDGTSSAALGSAALTPLFITGTVDTEGPDGSSSDPVFVTGSVAILEQPIEVTGSLTLTPETNPNATVTQVAASVTVVTLQAANSARRALSLFYNGNRQLYVKLGSGATTSDFTVRMSAQSYYEVPGHYTGIVTGIWNNAGGANNFVQVTEVTD